MCQILREEKEKKEKEKEKEKEETMEGRNGMERKGNRRDERAVFGILI